MPKRRNNLQHEFVKFIPRELKDGIIYISVEFATALHKCCCGCGNEVVTPLSPTDWRLTFDGRTISLNPSIGCWNFKCKSHYWIERNKVKWSAPWSKKRIEKKRICDWELKEHYYKNLSK